jgi:8-oxo-dGTP pyrophosphatase MutT (NUDIX family)
MYGWALTLFRHLPHPVRLGVVRVVAPGHTVGALCLLEHDGRFLLLRQRHREGWTLPGGLLHRGETAAVAAVREVAEETGLRVEVTVPVTAVVDPANRRVDILFHVPVAEPVRVVAGSEAFDAAWLTPQEASPLDGPTQRALEALAQAVGDPARAGRLQGPVGR